MEVARRTKQDLGEHANAGPCRDLAKFAGGASDRAPITDDDLGFDIDVPIIFDKAFQEEETLGTVRGSGRAGTKEGEG